MIVDVRTYTLIPRKLKPYVALFEELAMPVMLRHVGAPLAYFTSEIGALNQVHHIWGYDDMADLERKRGARDADPDWADFLQRTEGLVLTQENKIMRPTAFSGIK